MGSSLSRPQYGYRERYRPSDYSMRVFDPRDYFLPHPDMYHDPMGLMEAMFDSGYWTTQPLYGPAPPGIPLGHGGGGPVGGPGNVINHIAADPGAITGLGSINQSNPMHGGWPAEWKDPREWTTRDYDRLGEIMAEHLSRQRGRGMYAGLGAEQGGSYGQGNMVPSGQSPIADVPWESSGRKSHRHRPSYSDIDQLREQMMAYAQQAKEHMQTVNDCLYGSEREQREERYRERQRKVIEDILKSLLGAGQNSGLSTLGQQSSQGMSGMGFAGNPMMSVPGFAGINPMTGMPSMFPGGADHVAYAGMDGSAQRAGAQRLRRGMHGHGFNDGFEGSGFDEMAASRRARRRRGFEDPDDGMMDMGDGRHSPSGPRRPRRPGPGKDGATFDDRRRDEFNPAASGPARAGEPSRYETSPQPPSNQERFYRWPAMGPRATQQEGPGLDNVYMPPHPGRNAARESVQEHGRSHVSFQDHNTPNVPSDSQERHNS